MAKAAAGLARRRGGGVGEHGRRERQPVAQLGPLGDERRELGERRAALAGERHGGAPPAGLQLG